MAKKRDEGALGLKRTTAIGMALGAIKDAARAVDYGLREQYRRGHAQWERSALATRSVAAKSGGLWRYESVVGREKVAAAEGRARARVGRMAARANAKSAAVSNIARNIDRFGMAKRAARYGVDIGGPAGLLLGEALNPSVANADERVTREMRRNAIREQRKRKMAAYNKKHGGG